MFLIYKQKTNSESSDSPKAIKPPKSEKKEKNADDKEEASDDGNNATEDEDEEKQESQVEEKSKPKKDDGDEEDDWDSYKMESKKENSLDTKLKESHLVHCPYFPGVWLIVISFYHKIFVIFCLWIFMFVELPTTYLHLENTRVIS